ncbi:MAG: hypothetical protein HYR85_22810 [Planctomycetes bacterium]|nr:hypothetical protein [Planctomycetota bacterium]MBI3844370.1 hypothetical protein [Planctomycetota bacterium]
MSRRFWCALGLAAAVAAGGFALRGSSDVHALGCANFQFSGAVSLPRGTRRMLTTVPPSDRLVISTITSRAFDSSTPPWLEIYANSTRVGIVPAQCDVHGWHFDTRFDGDGAANLGGFHVGPNQQVGLRLVAGNPTASSVLIALVGLQYVCNLTTGNSLAVDLAPDVQTPVIHTPIDQSIFVRAAFSAPFTADPNSLHPSIEVRENNRIVGVIPAHCRSTGWAFETDFPFVTGIVVRADKDVNLTLRDAGALAGTIPISIVTLRTGP